ncbi:MAG: ABC transporter ATP-binding protein, partial [Ktedonobacterales bacterium]
MSVAYSDPPSQVDTAPLCVSADNLVKIYKVDDLEVMALQGLDLEVATG